MLDIGAGSGILVEAARNSGILAEGIEPSKWLSQKARAHGCNVFEGILPNPNVNGFYDIVMLIDVIEHVSDPVTMILQATSHLAPTGVLLVVTPDVGSFAARIMGWKWWHYRVAHIGYFNSDNLEYLCNRAGLRVDKKIRPTWFFTLSYLRQRLVRYIPWWLLPKGNWMDRITIPVNLFDSYLFVLTHADR